MHFAIMDEALLKFDRKIGFDTPSFVALMAGYPIFHRGLAAAYTLTLPIIYLSVGAAALIGERLEAWRAAFCFAGSLLTVCLIAILVPAKGVGVWMGSEVIARLPGGSPRYFWNTFDAYYGAKQIVLRSDAIDGVVSFPSFHAVMGLITISIWRRHLIPSLMAVAWFILMLTATIPLGGHYLVDLLGGVTVWACWFALSCRFTTQRALRCEIHCADT